MQQRASERPRIDAHSGGDHSQGNQSQERGQHHERRAAARTRAQPTASIRAARLITRSSTATRRLMMVPIAAPHSRSAGERQEIVVAFEEPPVI